MRRSGIVPTIGTLDQLLSLILRSEMFAEAWPMFRDIVTIGPSPSLRTFNELILGFCRKGFIRCALAMVGLMQRYGLFPDARSFRNVFKACFAMGRKKDAFEVFAYMLQNGFCLPDVSSCTFLVDALCKEGRLEEARELFDRMETEKKRGSVAYSALIYGYAKFGKTESAREVYMEMDSRGVTPNCYTFNALVYGYSKTNCLNEALITFDELCAKGLIPNNYVYNSLIYGFCRSGLMEEALKVENQMMRNGLVPDIFTNTIMIFGYCRVSMLDRAYEKLMDVYNKGMQPDVVTYTTFIHAYCKDFDMGNAMNILNTMRLEGIEPNIRTYNVLIHALCRRYSMGQAMRLIDELTSIGLVPTSVTCNTIINGICSDVLDRAIIIIGKLLKIAFVPDTFTVNLILTHFCRQNMPHRALRWERRLRDVSFVLDDVTLDILRLARDKQERSVVSITECDRAILLEFLMHVTYDFLLRNKPQFTVPLLSSKKMDCDRAAFQLL